MNSNTYWSLLALISLLLLTTCQSASTPEYQPIAKDTPSASTTLLPTVTPLPPTDPPRTPTSVRPTEPAPTPTPPPAMEEKGNADVLYVRAVQATSGTWTFHVTVQHPDTGWEDYADGWDILTKEGTVLKPDPDSPFTRLLLHPHENEQPFTRSQSNIVIPSGVTQLLVRAHDLVDGCGGREVLVDLTIQTGEDFEVERSP